MPAKSTEPSEWLIWQLVDSLLPTGGFTTSSGLEAALQLGYVKTTAADPQLALLYRFLQTSLQTTAASSLPFITAVYNVHSLPQASCSACHLTSGTLKDESADLPLQVQHWIHLDSFCHATITNTVARRASTSQGSALLSLLTKATLVDDKHCDQMSRLSQFRKWVLSAKTPGHLPVAFAVSLITLSLPLPKALYLFLFLHVRTLLSAAVRLNILGPYKAQELLARMGREGLVETVVEKYKDLDLCLATQTSPLIDMCQASHDRLYSRLFNS
jgi:urease accessory protein